MMKILTVENMLNLIPTHNYFRDQKMIEVFLEQIKEGRIFRGRKKIVIVQFEDEKLYLRDGHHRVAAAIAADIDLLPVEYIIETSTYDRYMEAHPRTGWFTPFDPREQCRIPDFYKFKNEAEYLYREVHFEQGIPPDFSQLYAYIDKNVDMFREPREVKSFKDLMNKFRSRS